MLRSVAVLIVVFKRMVLFPPIRPPSTQPFLLWVRAHGIGPSNTLERGLVAGGLLGSDVVKTERDVAPVSLRLGNTCQQGGLGASHQYGHREHLPPNKTQNARGFSSPHRMVTHPPSPHVCWGWGRAQGRPAGSPVPPGSGGGASPLLAADPRPEPCPYSLPADCPPSQVTLQPDASVRHGGLPQERPESLR